MPLRTIAISLLIGAWFAPASLAAPKLKIATVELNGYVGKDLKLSYTLPCGATYYGLVTHVSRGGTRLSLGVAYLMGDIRCASTPSTRLDVVTFINTTGFKSIAPMRAPHNRHRIVQAPVHETRRIGTSDKVQLIYTPQCGETIGTVIRRASDGGVSLGILESRRSGGPKSSCPATTKIRDESAFRLDPKHPIAILPAFAKKRPQALRKTYELRLARVHPNSIKNNPKEGIALKYVRRCNEAPVGLVLDSSAKKATKVGMVVAHYYNLKCSESPKWNRYHNKNLRLPAEKSVALLLDNRRTPLRITLPASFSRKSKRSSAGIAIEYLKPCDKVLGTLYHDKNKNTYIGMLTRARARTCTVAAKNTTVFQPFLTNKTSLRKVRPLRLLGTPAH